MKTEGNIITKYWLKRFKWYDIRFLVTLPLFIIYFYILIFCIFSILTLQLILMILEVLTNIKHFKIKIEDEEKSGWF